MTWNTKKACRNSTFFFFFWGGRWLFFGQKKNHFNWCDVRKSQMPTTEKLLIEDKKVNAQNDQIHSRPKDKRMNAVLFSAIPSRNIYWCERSKARDSATELHCHRTCGERLAPRRLLLIVIKLKAASVNRSAGPDTFSKLSPYISGHFIHHKKYAREGIKLTRDNPEWGLPRLYMSPV